MITAPVCLKDAKELLTENGFAASNRWYHGTSATLVDSIMRRGLIRSGDQALNAAARKTMATIGNQYQERTDPVFLTQSKELAFYWAEQTVRARSVRFGGGDQPAVLAVTLPDSLNKQVKPDVGAASLLLLPEGEHFMAYLTAVYQKSGFGIPEIDLANADRQEYLKTLAMAYLDADIDAPHLEVLTGPSISCDR